MIVHAKHDGSTDRVIFMLHGTGGNENDLVNLARYIDETKNTDWYPWCQKNKECFVILNAMRMEALI
ncbi:hypothetical protein MGH68_15915 [Erysipelothrix sp. D19-032]